MSFDRENLRAVRDAIYSLKQSEDVLVLRRGALALGREQWVRILDEECKLLADRRHFDPEWAAAVARSGLETVGDRRNDEKPDASDPSQQVKLADWWEVSYQPDKAAAYSYSNTRQPLHTDTAWFSDPSEINFFIMQKQAIKGGEQNIYPLSRLIEDLATEEPDLFSDLCNVQVTIKKGDGDFVNRTSIIAVSDEPRIAWNYYRTEKQIPAIKVMCDSFFAYLERKESTASVERFRCETGDCFCFNDVKMLHGRTAFTATKPFDRILLQSMWRLPN